MQKSGDIHGRNDNTSRLYFNSVHLHIKGFFNPTCPVSGAHMLYCLFAVQKIYFYTDWQDAIKRFDGSKNYSRCIFFDRNAHCPLAGWWHDPFYNLSHPFADRFQVFCHVRLSTVFTGFQFDRYCIRNCQHHGDYLHDHRQGIGNTSFSSWRCYFIRCFCWRQMFPHVIKCPVG